MRLSLRRKFLDYDYVGALIVGLTVWFSTLITEWYSGDRYWELILDSCFIAIFIVICIEAASMVVYKFIASSKEDRSNLYNMKHFYGNVFLTYFTFIPLIILIRSR